jgi:hypothetical protein
MHDTPCPRQKTRSLLAVLLCLTCFPAPAESDMEAMQRQLNAEVLSSPFNAGDIRKAEAYAAEALKNQLQPVAVAPSYWRPGWSCGHLTRYRHYNYYDYRNCVYYHRYYGRYW